MQGAGQAIVLAKNSCCFLRPDVGSRQLHTIYKRSVGHGLSAKTIA
jgi:hypothetical protein